MKQKPHSAQELHKLFENLDVENVRGTDCSFIAAFMLMTKHDRDYPFKIMSLMIGGNYRIEFPGYDADVIVRPADLERFQANATERRWRWKELFRKHRVPEGIDVLRCGYYDAQRRSGERPPEYRVYGGGNPVSDLMVLTGIREGGVIFAEASVGRRSGQVATFANSTAKRLKCVLRDGRTVRTALEEAQIVGSPLRSLGDLQDYMVIAASAKHFGVFHRVFGKTIPNHAYYLLGVTGDSEYVLGNPYQTKKTLIISENDFLKEFSSVHYVKIR